MFMATDARRPVSSTYSVFAFWSVFSWSAPYCGGSLMESTFFSAMMSNSDSTRLIVSERYWTTDHPGNSGRAGINTSTPAMKWASLGAQGLGQGRQPRDRASSASMGEVPLLSLLADSPHAEITCKTLVVVHKIPTGNGTPLVPHGQSCQMHTHANEFPASATPAQLSPIARSRQRRRLRRRGPGLGAG